MSSLLSTMSSAASGMMSQSDRIRVVSENVANIDTPGYRRKLLTFENALGANGATVRTGPISLDQSELSENFDPSHPMANAEGYVTMSNVNLGVEIADAREAQRSYEANRALPTPSPKSAARQ